MKNKQMKLVVLSSMVLFMVGGVGVTQVEGVSKVKHNSVFKQSTIKGKQVLENDDVKIIYKKNTNGTYDLIIEPKNGTNLSPETDLQGSKWYKDAYLIGSDKKRAQSFWQKNFKKYFKFSWNN